jgi:heat shock protein HslJ
MNAHEISRNEKKFTLVLTIISLSLMVVTSCAIKPENSQVFNNTEVLKSTEAINNTEWILTDLNGKPLPTGRVPTLNIAADIQGETRVSGFASCNTYRGQINRSPSKEFLFEKIGMTYMSCLPEQVNRQERLFLTALELATSFNRDKETLLINVKGQIKPLIFKLKKQSIRGL